VYRSNGVAYGLKSQPDETRLNPPPLGNERLLKEKISALLAILRKNIVLLAGIRKNDTKSKKTHFLKTLLRDYSSIY
jgi:hypothetical protein